MKYEATESSLIYRPTIFQFICAFDICRNERSKDMSFTSRLCSTIFDMVDVTTALKPRPPGKNSQIIQCAQTPMKMIQPKPYLAEKAKITSRNCCWGLRAEAATPPSPPASSTG